MDRICAACGKQLKVDQGFCEQCGAAWKPRTDGTNVAGDAAAHPAPEPFAARATAVPATARGSNKTLIGVSMVAIIALAAGAWFFMTHRAVAAPPDAVSAVSSTASSTTVNTAVTATAQPGTVAAAAVIPPVADVPPAVLDDAAMAAATDAAATSKPCSLITRAEMETILGSKIVRLTSTESECAYFTDAARSAQVETTWTGGKDALAQTKGFNGAEGLFIPVPGIGDEAYLQAGGVLHVLKGDTYVVVNSREYLNELETESAIARKVVANLK